MFIQYACEQERRLELVRESASVFGIEYLEVVGSDSPEQERSGRVLLAHFGKPVPLPPWSPEEITSFLTISGGDRIRGLTPTAAGRADALPSETFSSDEIAYYAALPLSDEIIVVVADKVGDFSTYTLTCSDPVGLWLGADMFDPILRAIRFRFRQDCPELLDCQVALSCSSETPPTPSFSYLAKDYDSFRHVLVERISQTLPDWAPENPLDILTTIVETLAYRGDFMSYYQDAVATEAYLSTARRRESVRRHARLVDYEMSDGRNARTWVEIRVSEEVTLPAGTTLLTRVNASEVVLAPDMMPALLRQNPAVFETVESLIAQPALNVLEFYTWGDDDCCLPRGATHATLKDPGGLVEASSFGPGSLLLLEESRSPESGATADADPSRRQVVRVESLTYLNDPLDGTQVVNVNWSKEDALSFDLCVSPVQTPEGTFEPAASAGANLVLADHGQTVSEALPDVKSKRYRPSLSQRPLTQARQDSAPSTASASEDTLSATATLLGKGTVPWVRLDAAQTWYPLPDLLRSPSDERAFVVETSNEAIATLRFGDDINGLRPTDGTDFIATYRVGNGIAGNIGADSLAHAVTTLAGIEVVRNPVAATGGQEPESLGSVRISAPVAYRRQERAVTAADWRSVAERFKGVQRAGAHLRWTGSWYTAYVSVDRVGGLPLDASFVDQLSHFLDSFRIAGYDFEIQQGRSVPVRVALGVCLERGVQRSDVVRALGEAFGTGMKADGNPAFFNPDRWTFGQSLYLSDVIAAAMAVDGVRWITVTDSGDGTRFERVDKPGNLAILRGFISVADNEIIEALNNPNFPDRGTIQFITEDDT